MFLVGQFTPKGCPMDSRVDQQNKVTKWRTPKHDLLTEAY